MPRTTPPVLVVASTDRRSFLKNTFGLGAAALLSPALLSACGSSSKQSAGSSTGTSLAPTGKAFNWSGSFQTGWVPTVEQAGTYIADSKGYFTQHGLSLEILTGGPNTAVDTVVISGKAAVGNSNTDAVAQMIKNGASVKVIGARFQKSPFCIYSLAAKALTKPQDLVGKKIGVAAGNEAPFKVFLAINQIAEKDVTVVPVQFDPTPTANGEVDGQAGFLIDQPATLRAKGLEVHSMLFSDFGYSIYSSALFATTDTIDKHPDLLAAFLAGERAGWQDNVKDPSEGARLAVEKYGKDTGLDLKQQTLASQGTVDLMVTPQVPAASILTLTEDLIAKNVTTLKSVGIDVTAEQLFDTRILKMI